MSSSVSFLQNSMAFSQVTLSTGRLSPPDALGFEPITFRYSFWVTSNFPAQKPPGTFVNSIPTLFVYSSPGSLATLFVSRFTGLLVALAAGRLVAPDVLVDWLVDMPPAMAAIVQRDAKVAKAMKFNLMRQKIA